MKISKITKGLVLVGIVSGMLMAGCELIVDFDRTRIPAEDAGLTIPDANIPTPTTDAGDTDAGDGTDAGLDASTDAADAAADSGADADAG